MNGDEAATAAPLPRVVVVDDDEWIRRGRADALRQAAVVESVQTVDHAHALRFASSWDEVDVVIVDAHDENASFDYFAGVKVVQAIRARRTAAETRVIVITGHVLNELLRLRMAEAGADEMYGHGEVRSASQLIEVLLRPRRTISLTEDELYTAGLSPRSSPNAALEWIERQPDLAIPGAFADDESQKALPISRRRVLTTRQRIAQLAGLRPDARTRRSAVSIPEWRQIVSFVNRARGHPSRRDSGPGTEDHDER